MSPLSGRSLQTSVKQYHDALYVGMVADGEPNTFTSGEVTADTSFGIAVFHTDPGKVGKLAAGNVISRAAGAIPRYVVQFLVGITARDRTVYVTPEKNATGESVYPVGTQASIMEYGHIAVQVGSTGGIASVVGGPVRCKIADGTLNMEDEAAGNPTIEGAHWVSATTAGKIGVVALPNFRTTK